MMSFAVSIEIAEFCRSSSSKLCGPADWDSESLLHMSPPPPPRAGKARGKHCWRYVQCPAMREIIRTAAGTTIAIEAAKTRARPSGSACIALSTPECSQLHHATVFFPYKERSARGHKDVSETRDTARSRASRETPCLPLDVCRNGALEGAALRRH